MHSTRLDSATLFHDGDFDGCMYLLVDGAQGIVVTGRMLDEALASSPEDAQWLELTGPSQQFHDRHAVTAAPDYDRLLPGDWTMLTLRVARADVASFMVFQRATRIARAAEQLSAPPAGVQTMLADLDGVVRTLNKHLSPK